jgi:hypothetical protein
MSGSNSPSRTELCHARQLRETARIWTYHSPPCLLTVLVEDKQVRVVSCSCVPADFLERVARPSIVLCGRQHLLRPARRTSSDAAWRPWAHSCQPAAPRVWGLCPAGQQVLSCTPCCAHAAHTRHSRYSSSRTGTIIERQSANHIDSSRHVASSCLPGSASGHAPSGADATHHVLNPGGHNQWQNCQRPRVQVTATVAWALRQGGLGAATPDVPPGHPSCTLANPSAPSHVQRMHRVVPT